LGILDVIAGSQPATHLIDVGRQLGLIRDELDEQYVNTILSQVAKTLFVQSSPTAKSSGGEPLGDLATNVVISLTALGETEEIQCLLLNPLLESYGAIEQSYLDSLNLLKMSRAEYVSK
jgi:hypothetical protein